MKEVLLNMKEQQKYDVIKELVDHGIYDPMVFSVSKEKILNLSKYEYTPADFCGRVCSDHSSSSVPVYSW